MAAWTTRNVRLLIFILGFIITILVNIVAQQHIKSIHQTQNARVRLGAEDGAGAAGGTAETQYPADWREAIRTLHKQHAGNVEKVRPKRERPAPAAVPTVRAQKLSDPTQAPGGSELHHLMCFFPLPISLTIFSSPLPCSILWCLLSFPLIHC
eukprot:1364836-Rhodomonas_salina.1